MFVGATRELLWDRVSPELPLSPVVAQFGKYIKIIVVLVEEVATPQAATNAFDVLMIGASTSHAPPVRTQKTQKDKLYNDIVSFIILFLFTVASCGMLMNTD